jgi:hypothetical protein
VMATSVWGSDCDSALLCHHEPHTFMNNPKKLTNVDPMQLQCCYTAP